MNRTGEVPPTKPKAAVVLSAQVSKSSTSLKVHAAAPAPASVLDDHEGHIVRAILAKRKKGKGTQYQVDWEGVDEAGKTWDPTWEPAENLHPQLMADYEAAINKPTTTTTEKFRPAPETAKVLPTPTKTPPLSPFIFPLFSPSILS
jgi:hypothetical protein